MTPCEDADTTGTAPQTTSAKSTGRCWRLVIVIAGIIFTQVILYGPSLIGRKVLLPVDILAMRGLYLPQPADGTVQIPHDAVLSDLVLGSEPGRQFAVAELRAGRLPIWSPYEFCGSPNYRHPLCPAWFLNYLIASPIALAWSQVILSLFAGLGAYAFFRRSLHVRFWPAAFAAWCFPISGTFIIAQGCGTPPVVACLPWVLLCIEQTIRRPRSWGGPMLAVFTCITIISAAPDIAGQVLLASGFFGVWRYVDHFRSRWLRLRSLLASLALALGWALGVLMSLPLLLPLTEYSGTGARIISRSMGSEERPPIGLSELPQVIIPEIYGTSQKGSLRIARNYHPESSACGYAGLLATLVAAPLAFARRRKAAAWFWLALGILGLAWSLNVPGVTAVMRLPGMNMMSFNRFVFVTSFALLAMAAMGLDALLRGRKVSRYWSCLAIASLLCLLGWCCHHAIHPPAPPPSSIAEALLRGQAMQIPEDDSWLNAIESSFSKTYLASAVLAALGVLLWLPPLARARSTGWVAAAIGVLMVAELLRFGFGFNSQCDPALYFPRIPMLEEIAEAAPGRVIGHKCLFPNLSRTHGLRDVRGYDAVDPLRLTQVLTRSMAKGSPVLRAAATQYLVPMVELAPPSGIRLHPIMDMLGVRYVIFRGKPPEGFTPPFAGDDYWALINEYALPRVFVPTRVETVLDGKSRLDRMAEGRFSAKDVAFVEEPIALPETCEGTAKIDSEIPRRVSVSLDMKTPGLLVLSDLWDKGWRAFLNDQEVPILVANHAFRGVVAPAGVSKLEFRYEPESMYQGLAAAGAAIVILIGWVALTRQRERQPVLSPNASSAKAVALLH